VWVWDEAFGAAGALTVVEMESVVGIVISMAYFPADYNGSWRQEVLELGEVIGKDLK